MNNSETLELTHGDLVALDRQSPTDYENDMDRIAYPVDFINTPPAETELFVDSSGIIGDIQLFI